MALVGFPPVSDEDLVRLGELNPGWKFERDDDGMTTVSPTSTFGGGHSTQALRQIIAWADRSGLDGRVYDASTGFRMSTNAVRSPDASWLSRARIDALPPEAKTGFWRVCPDVVVEVASEWDSWPQLVEKIDMYAREGARYAIAIDPYRREVYELGDAPTGLHLDVDAIAADERPERRRRDA